MVETVEGAVFLQRKQKNSVFYVSDVFPRCDLLVLTSDVRMSV